MLFLGGLFLLIGTWLLAPPVRAQTTAAPAERAGSFPRASPNALVRQQVGATDVAVRYGRPAVRGREVFGGLVPHGEVWRTGANEATTITFSDDVTVAGQPLEAGTYALFTIPGPEQWTVIFNEEAEQWGAFSYDEGADVLRVEATPQPAPMQEQMAFRFEEVTNSTAALVLHWEETAVPVPLAVDTEEVLRRQAGAIEGTSYDDLARKARLLAAAGDFAAAAEAGRQAVEQAETMSEPPQDLDQLREQLQRWQQE